MVCIRVSLYHLVRRHGDPFQGLDLAFEGAKTDLAPNRVSSVAASPQHRAVWGEKREIAAPQAQDTGKDDGRKGAGDWNPRCAHEQAAARRIPRANLVSDSKQFIPLALVHQQVTYVT